MVAAFDTSFHRTIPDQAALYAIPYELSTKYGTGATASMVWRISIRCCVTASSRVYCRRKPI